MAVCSCKTPLIPLTLTDGEVINPPIRDPFCSVHGDTAQPLPMSRPDLESAHDIAIRELVARRDFGIAKYGTPLTAFNGRDQIRDASEDFLDAAAYLMAAREERRVLRNTCIDILNAYNGDGDISSPRLHAAMVELDRLLQSMGARHE